MCSTNSQRCDGIPKTKIAESISRSEQVMFALTSSRYGVISLAILLNIMVNVMLTENNNE